MRTAKTLIRLGGCPGWSESLLGAHAISLVLSWGGSNVPLIIVSTFLSRWSELLLLWIAETTQICRDDVTAVCCEVEMALCLVDSESWFEAASTCEPAALKVLCPDACGMTATLEDDEVVTALSDIRERKKPVKPLSLVTDEGCLLPFEVTWIWLEAVTGARLAVTAQAGVEDIVTVWLEESVWVSLQLDETCVWLEDTAAGGSVRKVLADLKLNTLILFFQ